MKKTHTITKIATLLFSLLLVVTLCFPTQALAKAPTLNRTTATLYVGQTTTLKVSSNEAATWSSSNQGVATVTNKGVVRGKKAGTATIKAVTSSGTATCTVTVKKQGSSMIVVKNKPLSLGESASSVVKKFGTPNRKGKSYYGTTTYIYNSSPSKILFVYMASNKVVGYFTCSNDFNFQGATVNTKKKSTVVNKNDCSIEYFCDDIGTGKVLGIRVTKDMTKNDYTAATLSNMEKEVFDLTNGLRALNNLPSLAWDKVAAKTAKEHSKDMATKNYFDHYNLQGESPFDRMKDNGIKYSWAAENIAAGQRDSVDVAYGWYQSSGHRKNMLNPNLTRLGVGIAYSEAASYHIYYTQNFYTPLN